MCYSLNIREIRSVIEEESDTVTVTIMMIEVFIALVRGMSDWLVKNKMNHAWKYQIIQFLHIIIYPVFTDYYLIREGGIQQTSYKLPI